MLPLCGFDQFFHEGSCHQCKEFHFNLDPQGTYCEPCLDWKHKDVDLFKHVVEGVCFDKDSEKEVDFEDIANAMTSDGGIFDYKACDGDSKCLGKKIGFTALIGLFGAAFVYLAYYFWNIESKEQDWCGRGTAAPRRKLEKPELATALNNNDIEKFELVNSLSSIDAAEVAPKRKLRKNKLTKALNSKKDKFIVLYA